ncbi:MAG: hypothetical protein HY727_15310 [Candidatus Rokubacteria bacterium]|nr:hypothetical protein [Candidatus Rokubacteria bacterium]
MLRLIRIGAVGLLAGACAAPSAGLMPSRAPDFKTSEIRRPALLVRVSFGPGEWSERERASLPPEYEGTLVEALNAKAVLARDVQLVAREAGSFGGPTALARAREVGADHAVLVDVRVTRGDMVFCRESRRPFRATTTVWVQSVEVFRVADGGKRLTLPEGPALSAAELDADCDDPKRSTRRSTSETIGEAVQRLVRGLVGP